jgi:predicted dehydrogenase
MPEHTTRREFLTEATGFTAATLLAAKGLGGVHVRGSDTINVALVGCGGRGSGAASNAMSVGQGPVRLVAMADVFADRIESSHENLSSMFEDELDVPPERRFIGFEAYRQAMDALNPGDIVILATPPAFRWVHFSYAIEKGLNVFMEKPVTVDGPTSRRMLDLAAESERKGLRVGVGLMSRHSRPMQELHRRVREGELGEIISQHGYRMQGAIATFRSPPPPPEVSELEYQVRRFHSFLWASGGGYNDFFIHIIDHLCWMKDAWPVRAQAVGGRHYRTTSDDTLYVDQNFDSYGVEYTYADGTTMRFDGRNIEGCQQRFSSHMHGTKGSAVVSASGDYGMPSRIFRGHNLTAEEAVWTSQVAREERNPYQNEWDALVDAIRAGRAFNEARRGVEASLVCNMGRMAAHMGRAVTFDEALAHEHEFAPEVDKLTLNSQAPLRADDNGLYPVPMPGILTDREF